MKSPESHSVARIGMALAAEKFETIGFAFRDQDQIAYGIDAHAELIEGEIATGRLLGIQVKSGPSAFSESEGQNFIFRSDAKHVEYWLGHSLPVLICLSDITNREIYWQYVSEETAISTGVGYKFEIPVDQMITADSLNTLQSLLTEIVPREKFTIVRTEDVSFGLAKRYAFHVVLNGTLNKRDVASVIRQVTYDGARRRYHRNHLVERKWGESDAHVVWTFVYPSSQDYSERNCWCSSLWIDPELPEQWSPGHSPGENVGDGIILTENSNYESIGELLASHELIKEDFLSIAIPLIDRLGSIVNEIGTHFDLYLERQINERQFVVSSARARSELDEICQSVDEMGVAPYECKDVESELRSASASAANVCLLYSATGHKTWDEQARTVMMRQNLTNARETISNARYELEKAR